MGWLGDAFDWTADKLGKPVEWVQGIAEDTGLRPKPAKQSFVGGDQATFNANNANDIAGIQALTGSGTQGAEQLNQRITGLQGIGGMYGANAGADLASLNLADRNTSSAADALMRYQPTNLAPAMGNAVMNPALAAATRAGVAQANVGGALGIRGALGGQARGGLAALGAGQVAAQQQAQIQDQMRLDALGAAGAAQMQRAQGGAQLYGVGANNQVDLANLGAQNLEAVTRDRFGRAQTFADMLQARNAAQLQGSTKGAVDAATANQAFRGGLLQTGGAIAADAMQRNQKPQGAA